jgi:iron complex transport system substrate-binding protein
MAGGRNIFSDAPSPWPQVSLEELVQRAPTILIVADESYGNALRDLALRPGWRDVAAVRTGRVYAVDGAQVNQPGPSVAATARIFADLLHPARGH